MSKQLFMKRLFELLGRSAGEMKESMSLLDEISYELKDKKGNIKQTSKGGGSDE